MDRRVHEARSRSEDRSATSSPRTRHHCHLRIHPIMERVCRSFDHHPYRDQKAPLAPQALKTGPTSAHFAALGATNTLLREPSSDFSDSLGETVRKVWKTPAP